MPTFGVQSGVLTTLLDSVTANHTSDVFAPFSKKEGDHRISWMSIVTGATGLSLKLQHSIDGVNWFDLDTSSSIVGELRQVTKTVVFLRVVLNGLAGAGASITVKILVQ